MLLVQFGINSTRDLRKFCQIGLAPAARPILARFPNITRTINAKLYSQSHDYLYQLIVMKTNTVYKLFRNTKSLCSYFLPRRFVSWFVCKFLQNDLTHCTNDRITLHLYSFQGLSLWCLCSFSNSLYCIEII